ncbi:energy transducer TonB [Lysobacter niastensis]|uniref:Peptidylprolyl isomerase n=1 Tax=Lysobacter niastensis TaxID=380629 RepID=A0ABS0B4H5_9GAMM|nr:hypothetical protein [Lysobacter niastensis]MBF6023529.1 hypothetical protein [Lysobacter niastensis]
MDRKYAFAALPLLAAVLAAPCISNAADAPDKPVLVHMQAALDIDRDGRVAAVELIDGEKLPDVIRQQAQQRALALKFQPPVKAGQPVGGRTYAHVQACIAPKADGLDVSFAFTGNGPASTYHPPRKPQSPALPIAKLMGQGIDGMKGKVVYVVSVDGKATLERATLDDPELQAQYGELWLKDQRAFFKRFRYRPELIDGVPTPTRVEDEIENRWVRYHTSKEAEANRQAERQARAESSDACRALRSDDGRQLASDSPFKRIDG